MAISGESNEETGTSNPLYNLVSVLYHALQGVETCGQYRADAERAGDEPLEAFFRAAQASQRALAEEAKAHLGEHLAAMDEEASLGINDGTRGRRSGPGRRGGAISPKGDGEDAVEQASEESFPASDSPAY